MEFVGGNAAGMGSDWIGEKGVEASPQWSSQQRSWESKNQKGKISESPQLNAALFIGYNQSIIESVNPQSALARRF